MGEGQECKNLCSIPHPVQLLNVLLDIHVMRNLLIIITMYNNTLSLDPTSTLYRWDYGGNHLQGRVDFPRVGLVSPKSYKSVY